jgi:hypothetical protein
LTGATGSTAQPGALSVYDSTGTRLGALLTYITYPPQTSMTGVVSFRDDQGRLWTVFMPLSESLPTSYGPYFRLYYVSSDCSGQDYAATNGVALSHSTFVNGSQAYVVNDGATSSFGVNSTRDGYSGACGPTSGVVGGLAVAESIGATPSINLPFDIRP